MRVVVTGGSGKVGRAAIKALKAAGHTVVNFDIKPSQDSGRFVPVDCGDFGEVMGALSGIDMTGRTPDAVVHLAGIPAPGLATDHKTFEFNTLSTYNVFSACRRLGVKKIVWASSETILGLPFTTAPDYAPLDENHPRRPEWSYSLSKLMGETMAEEFARWDRTVSISSLRFSNVFDPSEYGQIPKIQANPEPRRLNLWSYVDARDCGEACRLAVENGKPGHEAYIIAAADILVDQDSAELMKTHFPTTELRDLEGNQALLSSAKAGRLLGYQPRHSWRDA
jgi:nucleoside-diphosphate-sugar epimerase